MRIGISTTVIQRGQTGVAQYVFGLLRGLVSSGHTAKHEFTLFVLEQDLPLFDFLEGRMQVVPVSERHRPPIKAILWHQVGLLRLARERNLDVLHVPSYRRLIWKKSCALVATIHDLAPFRVPDKYDWKRNFYAKVIVRSLARRQDSIIAVSQSTADDIHRFFGINNGKITVIHNGLDHGRFSPGEEAASKQEVDRRYGLDKPFLLYVARLEHPGKNHLRLISAFEEFKAATGSDCLLAFGGSDWHGAEIIHAAIRQSPFAASIRSLGFLPDPELPGLYRAAHAFVYPSLYEGFGLPPLEAMACGCPVICSPRGSLREIISDAASIVDPEDVHSIARELFKVTTDQALRNRLRAAGLAQARKFDWSKTAIDTMNVYQRA
jgi:glycosyltransferase involved in cell wall biosynthesis